MKEINEYEKDLASIRTMMERSDKFISLSGMAGIMAGIYALAGAAAAYFVVGYPLWPEQFESYSIDFDDILWKLLPLAVLVLVLSISTGLWLSQRKANRAGIQLWNATSQKLLLNLAIPLITGGLFILCMLFTGHFGLAAPACLIFYGLALIHASDNTVDEVRYLGFSEIVLGLVCGLVPGYGLVFWSVGFGLLHILYGSIMYNKYDR